MNLGFPALATTAHNESSGDHAMPRHVLFANPGFTSAQFTASVDTDIT